MSALLANGTADKEVTDLCGPTNLLGRTRALAPKLRERDLTRPQAGQIPAETIEDFWDFKLNYVLRPKKFGAPAMRPDAGPPMRGAQPCRNCLRRKGKTTWATASGS